MNDFQGQEVKSCEDKLGSSGNNVSNDQTSSSANAEFKRSNSGQMLSNQKGDTGMNRVLKKCRFHRHN